MNKRIILGIILSLASIMLMFFIILFCYGYNLTLGKLEIKVERYLNDDLKHNIKVLYEGNTEEFYCSLDNKKWLPYHDCNFSLKSGAYTVYLKNKFVYFQKDVKVTNKLAGNFSSSLDNVKIYYLALDGYKEINFNFDYPNNFNKEIIWKIEDNNVVSIKNNTIYGKNVGTTKIHAILKDGNKKTYTIEVTNLIKPMKLDNSKKLVPCGHYTNEENVLLDEILASRVKEAGIGTRGGVVAAIRFITMEFPYAIPYFYENGRLVDNGYRPHLDGEGRYYHKGLYLSEAKYETLEDGATSKSGPKMWGCDLYSTTTKQNDANGVDCSGFVSWAMLNGGFAVGDVGAGDYKEFDTDLSDLGKKNNITKEYIENGSYKVGDFIAKNGHAALIIGIDDKNIYTAEALPPKVKVYTYSKASKIFTTSNLKYIIEMDNIYPNGEGIYTKMW